MVLEKTMSTVSATDNQLQNTFSFEDSDSKNNLLNALNEQRNNQEFCDVILCCENREIPAHKPVLAAASHFFKDLLHESNNNSFPYVAVGDIDPDVLEALVNFSYTARLDLAADNVERLYVGSRLTKFRKIEEACIEFQRSKIQPLQWLGVWTFARKYGIQSLIEETEKFVSDNFANICFTKAFLHLPRLQIELMVKTLESFDSFSDAAVVCEKVVNWAKMHIEEENYTWKGLLEENHLLYLSSEDTLKECTADELDHDTVGMQISATEAQEQYLRQASWETSPVGARPRTPSSPLRKDSKRKLTFSNGSTDMVLSTNEYESEFRLLAAMQRSENCFIGVGVLWGMLTAISVTHQTKSTSCSVSTSSNDSLDLEEAHWSLLAPMYRGRCSVGAAELGGKLYAVGGYNRGDCLDTMEIYDPVINEWQPGPALKSHRGRLGVGIIDYKIYSVGGSNGHQELNTVEFFEPNLGEWQRVADMNCHRSQLGVSILDSKLFAVGGSSENTILKSAEVFNPEMNSWTKIASMNQPRENLCVASTAGKIYALGGSTGWSCLNTVECYIPSENRWTFVAPMKTQRRGAGVAVLNGCLYLIGGSDGSSFLNTVECYQFDTGLWVPVPSMSTPRQNVGVAVIGECIYAVGGFTGQAFLNTIEYFDVKANKWNSYIASA